jgi:hypothetical protein
VSAIAIGNSSGAQTSASALCIMSRSKGLKANLLLGTLLALFDGTDDNISTRLDELSYNETNY